MSFMSCIFRISLHDPKGLGYNQKVRRKLCQMYGSGCRTNHLLACMIDVCEEVYASDEFILSPFHIDSCIEVSKNDTPC